MSTHLSIQLPFSKLLFNNAIFFICLSAPPTRQSRSHRQWLLLLKIRCYIKRTTIEQRVSCFYGRQINTGSYNIIRRIIETANEKGKQLYLVFVYLHASFDTDLRYIICRYLAELIVTEKLTQVIKNIHKKVIGELLVKSRCPRKLEIQKDINENI